MLDFFENHEHRIIHKWMHYFEIYERHFSKFQGQEVSVLEFGVLHGGSLQMWRHYFGDRARIYGVDINPRCGDLNDPNIAVLVGNQEDVNSLRAIKNGLPLMDIIIDDGGHSMLQQTLTFEELYGHLKEGGVYLCEDMHTSYWPEFGGSYRKSDSFMEYSKRLIDKLNAWHSRGEGLSVDAFAETTFGMHYYDSILVIEKRKINPPHARMKGTPSFPLTPGAMAVHEKG